MDDTNTKRSKPNNRALQKYQKSGLPAKLDEQVWDVTTRLSIMAKGWSTEFKDIRPRLTQALVEELKARLEDL